MGRCSGVLSMLYSDSLRKMMQNGGLESFWGGLGVEFEAKYIFNFRVAPRGREGSPPYGRSVSGDVDCRGYHPLFGGVGG